MSTGSPEPEHLLHAYVDGQLSPTERLAVEACLAGSAELRARIDDYRRINMGLKALYGAVVQEPVPPTLLRRRRRSPLRRAVAAAAVVVAVVVGGAAGWIGRDLYSDSDQRAALVPLLSDALSAHVVYTPEVRHPVEVAGSEAHLLPWLSKRLGTPIRAPSLERLGYRLLGGRLLPGRDGASAQLMYEQRDGRRLTLYLSHSFGTQAATAFRYAERDGLGVFYWIDGRLACALVGELSHEELSQAAHLVYEALELAGS